MTLTISVDDVSDMEKMLGDPQIVKTNSSCAEDVIDQGGKIVVQMEYINAEPDILAVFTTKDEIQGLRARLKDIEAKLQTEQ